METFVGTAVNSKSGATLVVKRDSGDEDTLHIESLSQWPEDLLQKRVVVQGVLHDESQSSHGSGGLVKDASWILDERQLPPGPAAQRPDDDGKPLSRLGWWDNFYEQHTEVRDWYLETPDVVKYVLSNELVAAEVTRASTKSGVSDEKKEEQRGLHVLNVGCGSSDVPLELWKHGIKDIVNVDFSPSVISTMKKTASSYPGLSFLVADAMHLVMFRDGEFDVLLDKGTLDCVILAGDKKASALLYLQEASRVLRSGGWFYIFSLFGPEDRLDLLKTDRLGWSVEYVAIASPPLELPDQTDTHLYKMKKVR